MKKPHAVPRWLLKTEPREYSFADLKRDGQTTWDGISNPQAKKYLREIAFDDVLLIYHTGDEKQIVGTARCVEAARTDAESGEISIQIAAMEPVARPVSLGELKVIPELADWALVRQPRLSVMPIPTAVWIHIEALLKS